MKGLRASKKTGDRNWPVLIGAAAVLLLLVWWGYRVMNSPAVGTVKVNTASREAVTNDRNFTMLSNEYLTLLYPEDLSGELAERQATGALFHEMFTSTDKKTGQTRTLEVYVRNLPEGGVAVDSDYRDYRARQNEYKFLQRYYRGELVNIVDGQIEPSQRIAFWVHGDLLLIVKMSAEKSDLNIQFPTILKSVQWQKDSND